jgi:hypothetical protein
MDRLKLVKPVDVPSGILVTPNSRTDALAMFAPYTYIPRFSIGLYEVQREIDIILEMGSVIYPIEIKMRAKPCNSCMISIVEIGLALAIKLIL